MPESSYKGPEEFAHADAQADRGIRDADAYYTMAVFAESEEYIATQEGGSLEARGHSPAEAIANYGRAVEAKNNGQQVVRDDRD